MNMIRDPLDEMLKTDAREHRDHYIDDAGFTLRVMDAMPMRATPKRMSTAMRMWLPFGLALLAACGVMFFAGGKNFFIDVTMDLATETITHHVAALGMIAATLFAMLIASLVNDK